YPSAPYAPFQFPCVAVSVPTKAADPEACPAPPKNRAEATALAGTLAAVTRICTWPPRFQTRYWPPANPPTVRLSSTPPLPAPPPRARPAGVSTPPPPPRSAPPARVGAPPPAPPPRFPPPPGPLPVGQVPVEFEPGGRDPGRRPPVGPRTRQGQRPRVGRRV